MAIGGGDGSIVLTTKVDESGINKGFSAIKSGASKVAKGFAVVGAAAATAFTAISTAAVNSYAEYEQLAGGVETLFKDSSNKLMKYADQAYKTAGMSANEYMSTVTSFSASLLQSLEGDTEKSAEYANQAVIDMSDNANKMGTSIEMIQNAYQGFAKQNYTMLDNLKLGYGGTKEEMQRLLDDAEKISGIKYDISSFADVTQAIHVIQTEMGITGTTAKEASSTIQGSFASMKGAWQNLLTGMADENQNFDVLLENFINSIGTVMQNLLPRISVVLGGVLKLVEGLLPQIPTLIQQLLPMLIDGTMTLVQGLVAILPDLITTITDVLPDLITTIVQMLPTLIPLLINGVVQLILGIISAIDLIIQPIIDVLPDLIISIVEALVNNLPALIQGIILLVMGIVQAIPQIIQALVDALPTIIQMILTALLLNLPLIIGGLIQVVAGIVIAIPQIFASMIEAIVNVFIGIWNSLKEVFGKLGSWINTNVIKPIKNFFKGLWDSVSGFFSSLWNDIVGIWQSVSGWFNKNVIQPIKNFFSGLWDGLKDGAKGAWNGIKSVFNTVANFFKDIFSKAWEKVIGVFSVAGDIFVNIKDGIVSVFKTVVNGLIDGINKVVKLPFEGLNKILDKIHDIEVAGVSPFSWLTWRAPIPQLPKLATGAVLPPNKPFMAIVGDQKHGTNIEAPLDTIVEAMNIALQQNGNQQVNIIAKGDLDSIISLFKFEIERKDQLAGATI